MSLFSELKRRNVFRVGIAYLALAWVVMQIADVMVPALGLPEVLITIAAFIGLVGFPFALFFAWAFELTPEGMKRTEEVDLDESIRATTGQKINYIIIGLLSVAVIFLAFNQNSEPEIVINEKSIAVMPFADMSPDGSQEYFGDGIAEEILNVLVGIDELSVTSRTSSFAYKGTNAQIPDIAAELGVNYVLEGSIRTDGNQVRVTAQLIDVAADAHLWSDTFDRELTSIFAIQDEISRSITDAMRIELVGGEPLKVAPTDDMVAYDFYLRGRQLFNVRGSLSGTGDGMGDVIEYFERATEIDPTFAEAWADLASAYQLIPEFGVDGYENVDHRVLSSTAAQRAISLKPDLSQGWAIKGLIDLSNNKFGEAKTALEHAIALNDKNESAWLWLGQVFAAAGNHVDAVAATERAIELSPKTVINYYFLARAVHTNGDPSQLNELLDQFAGNSELEGLSSSPFIKLERLYGALDQGDRQRAEQLALELNRFDLQSREISEPENLQEFTSNFIGSYFEPELRPWAKEQLLAMEYQIIMAFVINDADLLASSLDKTRISSGALLSFFYYPMSRALLQQQVIRDYFNRVGMLDYWKDNAFPNFCRPVGEVDFECQDVAGNWP